MNRLKSRYRNQSIALLIVAMLSLSCEEAAGPKAIIDPETTATLTIHNLKSIESENGIRKYRFDTPLLEEFDQAKEPYREHKKGIKIETYSKDSVTIESTLVADYAHYNKTSKIWEARGHVVGRNLVDNKTVYTDQMFWDENRKKTYSHKAVKILDNGSTYYGVGFEADEKFTSWEFKKSRGRIEYEEKPDTTSKK